MWVATGGGGWLVEGWGCGAGSVARPSPHQPLPHRPPNHLSPPLPPQGASGRQVLLCAGPFTLVAPAAIMLGAWVGRLQPAAEMALLCGATGTFLYIGASEVMTEEFEAEVGLQEELPARARYLKFLAVLAGVAAMAAISFLPE